MFQKIIITLLSTYIRGLFVLDKQRSIALIFKLFSKPSKGKYQFKTVSSELVGFQYNKENIESNQIPYYSYTKPENKAAVLLIHGWNSNANRWQALLPYLKSLKLNIYIIEAPGHGSHSSQYFSVPAYAKDIYLLHKNYHFNYMLAHSIGGTALFYAVYLYEMNSIKKIVSLGAPSDMRILIDNFYQILKLPKNIQSSFNEFLEQKFNINIDEFSVSNFTKNIQIPVFLSHDQQDSIVMFSEAKKINQSLKTSETFWLNQGNHSMHNVELYQKIQDFLKNSTS